MSEYIFPQSDTLAESYPKLQNELIRQNEEDKRLQGEIDKHKASNDHTADKIRYDGKIPKDNVKDALDETDTRIDNIVSQGGSDNTEVVDARHSTTKGKTYPVLKDRLEDIEKDTNIVETVTETSYDSVIPVPDSATNGQVSGVVRGETRRNLFDYKKIEENINTSIIDNGIRIIDYYARSTNIELKDICKPNTTYTITANVKYVEGIPDDVANGEMRFLDVSGQSKPAIIVLLHGEGYKSKTVTLPDNLEGYRLYFYGIKDGMVDFTNIMFEEGENAGNYISYGTKSTVSAMRLKSVGKNLFDKNNAIVGKFITVETGEEMTSPMDISTDYIPCSPSSEYIQNVNARYTPRGVAFYDSNKNFISGSSNPTFGFVTPSNCAYFRTCFANDNNELETFQIEKGDTPTEYEPYVEDRAYITAVKDGKIVNLRSLPNGIKDEISLVDGRAIINTKKYTIQESDFIAIRTTYDNVDYIEIHKPVDAFCYDAVSSFNYGSVTIEGLEEFSGDYTNPVNIDKFTLMAHGQRIWIGVEKGTTLEQAKERLIGTTLTYQLAEPEIIPIRWTGLQAYENGTVYVDTVIPELGFYYDNGLESHYPDHPIKEVDTLYRVDKETGYKEPLDVSKCIISEDRLSFTHPDLQDGDLCDWDYVPMTESTRPETSLTFPTNLKASVNSLLDAEQINKKEHNIFKARLDNHDRDIERIDTDVENAQTAIDTAQSDINTHKQDKKNPHGVTPQQIGAETPSGAQAKTDAVQDDLNSHKNNYTTAHGIDVIIQDVSTIQSSIETSEQVTWSDPDILSSNVTYQKINGVVMITIFHNTLRAALDGYGRKTLFTLPTSLRPAFDVYFPLTFDNGAHYAVIEVTTHGNVNILSRQGSEIPTNVAFRGTACYPVRR